MLYAGKVDMRKAWKAENERALMVKKKMKDKGCP